MKIKKIINHLNRYKPEIINRLQENQWWHFQKYFSIREKYLKNECKNSFKRNFCNFYRMNGARGLNQDQKNKFFKLLSSEENSLEKILNALYKIHGHGKRCRLFFSFGTKLLHTINDKLPIYDGNIAYMLELSPQTYSTSKEERIQNRKDIYSELNKNFKELLANEQIKNYLKSVRQELQSKAKYDKFNWRNKYISDAKLLDSSLWALYPILKRRK